MHLVRHLSSDEDDQQEMYLIYFSTHKVSAVMRFSKQKQQDNSPEILVSPRVALALAAMYNSVKDLEDPDEKIALQ